ncbi:MAG: hypothetical protein AB7U41_04460 [Dongiaceae bacterium]
MKLISKPGTIDTVATNGAVFLIEGAVDQNIPGVTVYARLMPLSNDRLRNKLECLSPGFVHNGYRFIGTQAKPGMRGVILKARYDRLTLSNVLIALGSAKIIDKKSLREGLQLIAERRQFDLNARIAHAKTHLHQQLKRRRHRAGR